MMTIDSHKVQNNVERTLTKKREISQIALVLIPSKLYRVVTLLIAYKFYNKFLN